MVEMGLFSLSDVVIFITLVLNALILLSSKPPKPLESIVPLEPMPIQVDNSPESELKPTFPDHPQEPSALTQVVMRRIISLSNMIMQSTSKYIKYFRNQLAVLFDLTLFYTQSGLLVIRKFSFFVAVWNCVFLILMAAVFSS